MDEWFSEAASTRQCQSHCADGPLIAGDNQLTFLVILDSRLLLCLTNYLWSVSGLKAVKREACVDPDPEAVEFSQLSQRHMELLNCYYFSGCIW